MITVKKVSISELESAAQGCDFLLPIEQTAAWARYQATIEGRKPWGSFVIQQDGQPLAFISFIDFETHGFRSTNIPTATIICAPYMVLPGLSIPVKKQKRRFCRLWRHSSSKAINTWYLCV